MRRVLVLLIAVASLALLVTYLSGCSGEQEQPAEQVGEQAREMGEDVAEAVSETAEQAKEELEEVAIEAKEKVTPVAKDSKLTEIKEQAVEAMKEKNPLMNPLAPEMNEAAPETFRAKFETTKGEIVIEVQRHWAPQGADRFYNLVKNGYYDGCRFFRVIDGFMAQFGIHGDPKVNTAWQNAKIRDDVVKQKNLRGFLSYAMAGPNTRTTQLFINYGDNSRLDGQGFSPFGKVISGMEVADSFYDDYGEGAPRGRGPAQNLVQSQGNAYLDKEYPNLDYIEKATIVTP